MDSKLFSLPSHRHHSPQHKIKPRRQKSTKKLSSNASTPQVFFRKWSILPDLFFYTENHRSASVRSSGKCSLSFICCEIVMFLYIYIQTCDISRIEFLFHWLTDNAFSDAPLLKHIETFVTLHLIIPQAK